MRRYEIYDQDADGVLLFDLKDVLTHIPEAGHFQYWRLMELEAVGPDVLSIEGAVAKSKGGASLSWSVLLELAGSFEQVINLRLAGGDQSTAGNENETREGGLLLEVLDSTFWAVETNIEIVGAWLVSSFKHVRITESASV
jgi:hypothetical protein